MTISQIQDVYDVARVAVITNSDSEMYAIQLHGVFLPSSVTFDKTLTDSTDIISQKITTADVDTVDCGQPVRTITGSLIELDIGGINFSCVFETLVFYKFLIYDSNTLTPFVLVDFVNEQTINFPASISMSVEDTDPLIVINWG